MATGKNQSPTEKKQVPISTFEEQVEEIEGITIVVRGPAEYMVESYDYERQSAGNNTVAEWVAKRLRPKLGDLEIKIIDGEHESPRRSTKKLDTVRKSYEK